MDKESKALKDSDMLVSTKSAQDATCGECKMCIGVLTINNYMIMHEGFDSINTIIVL